MPKKKQYGKQSTKSQDFFVRDGSPAAAESATAAAVPERILSANARNALIARRLYVDSLTPSTSAADWVLARRIARRALSEALRDSKYLRDVAGALQQDGVHMLVFRQLLAPPTSQDQFRLICAQWPKSSECAGRKLQPPVAVATEACFHAWRDRTLTPWLNSRRLPTRSELRRVFHSVEPLLAAQQVSTARRLRMSASQEDAVVQMLGSLGWTHVRLGLVTTLTDLKQGHYAHKTRFATRTLPQEVDIACGLRGTRVLAMECKVTNDETNSVKRVNDVLKKASAWKDHWGNFVETAALLKGVIKPSDVDRLQAAGVHVFWSHDLNELEAWLRANA